MDPFRPFGPGVPGDPMEDVLSLQSYGEESAEAGEPTISCIATCTVSCAATCTVTCPPKDAHNAS